MKILVHDYAGHPFQVQLSRALARRGHDVIHVYATGLQTPRGELEARADDPAGFRLCPVEMDAEYVRFKYAFVRRRGMEVAYGRKVARLIRSERPDAVLSSNTPTEAQQSIIRATRRSGARFYFWAQDFYSLAVERLVKRQRPLVGTVAGHWYRWLEGRQLRASDGIVAITEDFVPIMTDEFGADSRRISVLPNWAPVESLPVRPKRNPWSVAAGLADRYVFLYSGTLAMKHNPALLLELARTWRHDDRVRIVVVSEGPGAEWLRAQSARESLPNIIQMGYQPFHTMADVLGSGDVLVAVLEPDAGEFSVPSKVLSYLCAERPILLAAQTSNLASRMVTGAEAGAVVPPGEVPAFIAASKFLHDDPAAATRMGRRGRGCAERTFRIGEIARRFEQILAGRPISGRRAAPIPEWAAATDPFASGAVNAGLRRRLSADLVFMP